MSDLEIADPLFREAVNAIDTGNLPVLEQLVTSHPQLLRERLKEGPDEGYFSHPYLLWFVADNPIRNPSLPPNIVAITDLLIRAIQRQGAFDVQQQFGYTLALVATGRIPRECGVQIQMIDLLIDAGAEAGDAMGAITHGNTDAAEHLLKRGGKLTLPVAVVLDRTSDIQRLLPIATESEKFTALTAAAFYGKKEMVAMLLKHVPDVNGYPDRHSGFHSHATPLHQALWSGSLDTVKLLVEAGARLDMPDKAYNGTAPGWAEYILSGGEDGEGDNTEWKKKIAVIADYLKTVKRDQ